MKRFVIISMLALLPLITTACNTIQGIGEDVTAVGKGLEDAVN
ncbi:entericidin EcnA/B family protein [Asticcacaulis biprosthecium C19]|uniref:Entericidin EcnA/B family protein n=1 Tax=Asticcacaulis biprosthecium C19 TaxID=715226 RepID=F4QLK3_9CAUL|nr:entericidin [Asticcacaulis biprosthecium]EGF93501.1 entericidin EcnA/B family protein [Asticcacaulis biprosthecium C19]